MTDHFTLEARSPLAGVNKHYGQTRLWEMTDQSIIAIGKPGQSADQTSPKGQFSAIVQKTLRLQVPMMGYASHYQDAWLLSHTLDQYFLMLPREGDTDSVRLATLLAGQAYVVDQSDAWAILVLQGKHAVLALQRLMMLDFHGFSMVGHACTRTMMMHMGVMLLRRDVDDFVLLVPRSMAADAWHHLELSLQYVQSFASG